MSPSVRDPEAEAFELSKQFSAPGGNKFHAINMVFGSKGIFVTGLDTDVFGVMMQEGNRDILFRGTYKECLAYALDYKVPNS